MTADEDGFLYYTVNDMRRVLGDKKLIAKFWKFMEGQTMGLNDDGDTMIYACDLHRFVADTIYGRDHRLVD